MPKYKPRQSKANSKRRAGPKTSIIESVARIHSTQLATMPRVPTTRKDQATLRWQRLENLRDSMACREHILQQAHQVQSHLSRRDIRQGQGALALLLDYLDCWRIEG